MNWVSLLIIVCSLLVVVYLYQSSQKTEIVAKEHQVPVPEGGITAIEYFWRPG
jgi:cbb3-type cytochrome oxidase subunit 3